MAAPSAFPQDLPERTQGTSWKDRNCPGMRNCWSISLSSYSLNTHGDKALLARRACMLLVLGVRTALSVLAVISDAYGGHVVSMILGIILGVLGFLFIAWCLAKIGDATGYRKVIGVRVGRWHFDVFLLAIAVIHIGMLIGFFFGFDGTGLGSTWIVMWLVIFGVAWIATWEPEQPPSNV